MSYPTPLPKAQPPSSAYSGNSLPNRSAEEKTTRNSVPWNKFRSILSEFPSGPFRGREKRTFELRTNHFVKLFCLFCTTNFLENAEVVRVTIGACELHKTSFFRRTSVSFQASELALPRNSECLGMSTFFRGITETVPSLFRGIFSERNSVPNPIIQLRWRQCCRNGYQIQSRQSFVDNGNQLGRGQDDTCNQAPACHHF